MNAQPLFGDLVTTFLFFPFAAAHFFWPAQPKYEYEVCKRAVHLTMRKGVIVHSIWPGLQIELGCGLPCASRLRRLHVVDMYGARAGIPCVCSVCMPVHILGMAQRMRRLRLSARDTWRRVEDMKVQPEDEYRVTSFRFPARAPEDSMTPSMKRVS